MKPPTHRERQIMQRLRGGWINAISLPSSPKTIQNLLTKRWIERREGEDGLAYRLTQDGLEAKKMPVRL
jgi:hypothetical protein